MGSFQGFNENESRLLASSVQTVDGSEDRVNVYLFARAIFEGFIPLNAFTIDDPSDSEASRIPDEIISQVEVWKFLGKSCLYSTNA
jgi:hypothetical protein